MRKFNGFSGTVYKTYEMKLWRFKSYLQKETTALLWFQVQEYIETSKQVWINS